MNNKWWLFGSLIFLDQASKWWAQQQGWVTWNEGIAFGAGGALAGIPMTLSLVFLLLVTGWVLWQAGYHRSLGGVMILTGATSNLIDRVVFGAVRDWWPVPLIGLQNNLADWLIGLGIIWLAISLVRPQSFVQG